MEDFLKQFRDNLERRPEPVFEEHDWQDMQSRLESDRATPKAWVWWWMAVPFMFLLTGSNAFFFWHPSRTVDGLLLLQPGKPTAHGVAKYT